MMFVESNAPRFRQSQFEFKFGAIAIGSENVCKLRKLMEASP